MKAYHKKQMVYAVKPNSSDKLLTSLGPKWLEEFQNVFLEELTELSPIRELDHAIELTPRAQPIARRLYIKFHC